MLVPHLTLSEYYYNIPGSMHYFWPPQVSNQTTSQWLNRVMSVLTSTARANIQGFFRSRKLFWVRSLGNMGNTSSQLENSVHYHFQVVFTSGELGNFKASPIVPLGILDLVSNSTGINMLKNAINS